MTTDYTLYTLTVATGDRQYASTGAKVYISLEACDSKTQEQEYENGFKAGTTVDLEFHANIDPGELRLLNVRHDNTGPAPGWFLDYITVLKNESRERWDFRAYRWLAVDEADKETKVVLGAFSYTPPQ